MEENRELFSVYKSEEEKTKIIIRHVLLMLSRRIYIIEKKKKQLLSPNQSKVEDVGDSTYVISARNGEKYAFKIIYHKITTIGKNSVIGEFIKNYPDHKKIIIANDFASKIHEFAIANGVQLFAEADMLRDLLAYKDQPVFELLTPLEMEQVKSEYNVSNYTITKTQSKIDPTVKYFGLKKSDIYRVIRPSPTSGYSINYRIVA